MRIDRSLEDEVSTTDRGFRKSTSVYGTLTGLGGDMFIIDDPQKPVDAQSDAQRHRLNQWVSNTLMSRLDSKEKGVIIIVQQRVLHPPPRTNITWKHAGGATVPEHLVELMLSALS